MRHSTVMLRLLATVAVLAPAAALAQTAPASPGDTAANDSANPNSQAEAGANSGEIVVTAQRRAERYVDVPGSVSVVTASQLTSSGVSSSTDLRLLTPGLNITQQGTYVQPTIRGVGTTVTGTGADPNVAVYVDGVYISGQGTALFSFNNIDQIETLKGPQGTLYGRNATGGAIVVTTKAPSLAGNSANVEASYGRFNEVRASGYINVKLSDTVAFNLAAYDNRNDGYTKNAALNFENSSYSNSRGIRGRLLWAPTSDLRVLLTGSHIFQSDNTAYSYAPINNNTPQRGSLAANYGLTTKDIIALNTRPLNKLNFTQANLNVDYTSEIGTITSISSYTYTKYPFVTDLDGTERNVQSFAADPQDQETVTQELIYSSPRDKVFVITGGLYYYHDKSHTQVQVSVGGTPFPFPPFRPNVHVTADAYAAYAEGTFNITPKLHLTAGGRYSSETKHALNNDGPTGVLLLDAKKTFNAFTPRASLRYDVTPQSSAYISYSEGFKSGLFDGGATGTCTTVTSPTCPFPGVPVQPEKVRSYEAGFKYNAHGTVFSIAAYYSQYKNIQINALNAINQQVLYNAAAGEIYGGEAEISTSLTKNLDLHAGAAYTHGRYTDFPAAQNFVPLANGGNAQATGNDTGNTLIRTPEFTAFASATYRHEVGSGNIEGTITGSYSSSYFWTVDNRLKQPAFGIINAHVSWLPTEKVKITLYGDNLTNERTQVYVREATVGDFASYSKPITYGLAVALKF